MDPRSDPVAARSGIELLAVLLLAGCAAAPLEPPPPPFSVEVEHYFGGVRTGPSAPVLPEVAEGASALAAGLRLTFVDQHGLTGSPVEVRHVFARGDGALLRTHSPAARGLVSLPAATPGSERAGDARVLWEASGLEALSPGTTVAWRTHGRHADPRAPGAELAPEAGWGPLEVQIARDARTQAIELALVFANEHLVLDAAPEPDGPSLAWFVPAPAAAAPAAGLILELALATAPDSGFEHELTRERELLAQARQRTLDGASDLSPAESFRFRSEAALRALESRRLQRPALVFLARETGASVTGELALLADDEALEAFLTAVDRAVDGSVPTDEPAAVGWFLDSTAYTWMSHVAQDPERELPAELAALLLVQTGQLGRYADLVEEVASTSPDLASFEARLLVENRIFLDDAHPAARVRALEWLRARGAAPEGFDPLAARDERRAALAAADAEEQQ